MKYYLLTFNDDYADEHNVPALACMTEKEYNAWLESPSGKWNPDYDKQKKAAEDYEKQWADFWKLLEEKGYTVNGHANTGAIPASDKIVVNLERKLRALDRPDRNIQKIYSGMNAYLGNSGEGFAEGYSNKYFMEEFVSDGTVKVMEVSEDFYETFHKAKLANLSLCNVFDINEEDYEDVAY